MNAAHASPCRLAACSLATLLLLAPLGCGSNTPIGRVSKSSQAMVNLLRPIKDASSATAAIPKIKPTFAEVAAANAAILQMMSDPAKVLSLMSQASNEMEEMSRTKDQMDAELERVDNLKGLPAEFWSVMRVESTRSLRDALAGIGDGGEMSASFQAMMVMYDQFGPQCVVELELRGVETGDKNAAIERLLKLAGPNATVAEVEDPEDSDIALLTVAPVDDFDKLAKGIDFGDVVDQEKAKGEIVVELPEAPAAEAAAADESPRSR